MTSLPGWTTLNILGKVDVVPFSPSLVENGPVIDFPYTTVQQVTCGNSDIECQSVIRYSLPLQISFRVPAADLAAYRHGMQPVWPPDAMVIPIRLEYRWSILYHAFDQYGLPRFIDPQGEVQFGSQDGTIQPGTAFDNVDFTLTYSTLPEPGTLGLLGLGLSGICAWRCRRARATP